MKKAILIAIFILLSINQAQAQSRTSEPFYGMIKAVLCLPQYTREQIEQKKIEVINSDDSLEILNSCPVMREPINTQKSRSQRR
jgi:hypothetical protein